MIGSIFKTIFKPSNWKLAFTKLVGDARGLVTKVGRGTRNGWASIVKLYRKHPAWFISIGSGTAVTFIGMGIRKLMDTAGESTSRDFAKYGTENHELIVSARYKEARSRLRKALDALNDPQVNPYKYRQQLLGVISAYHTFLQNQSSVDDVDLAVTADRMIGAAGRLGLQLEESASSEVVLHNIIQAKDNDENANDIANDLITVAQLDDLNLPLAIQ